MIMRHKKAICPRKSGTFHEQKTKEIMKRSRLRNNFLKCKIDANRKKIIVYFFFAEKRNPFSIT